MPSPPIYQLRPSGPPAIRCCNSDQADFILGDSPEPPPDSAAWQRQPLPDNWLVSSRLLSSSSALIASRTMPFKRSNWSPVSSTRYRSIASCPLIMRLGDNSKAARALHRAALNTNCRALPGSVRHRINARRHAPFLTKLGQPRTRPSTPSSAAPHSNLIAHWPVRAVASTALVVGATHDEVRYAAQMDRVRSLRHRPVLDTRCGASPPSLNANTESP